MAGYNTAQAYNYNDYYNEYNDVNHSSNHSTAIKSSNVDVEENTTREQTIKDAMWSNK